MNLGVSSRLWEEKDIRAFIKIFISWGKKLGKVRIKVQNRTASAILNLPCFNQNFGEITNFPLFFSCLEI